MPRSRDLTRPYRGCNTLTWLQTNYEALRPAQFEQGTGIVIDSPMPGVYLFRLAAAVPVKSSFGVKSFTLETESAAASVTLYKGYINYTGHANTLIAEATVTNLGGTEAAPHFLTHRVHKLTGEITLEELAVNPAADDGTYTNRVLWEVYIDGNTPVFFDRRPDFNYGMPIATPP